MIPISFICLEDVEFKLPLACNDEALWKKEKATIDQILKQLVEQSGLGRKTALGYGIGKIKEPPKQS